MKEQDFLQIPIQSILPQREPFIMVSQLLYYDDLVTITRFDIKADNIFCKDDVFMASGLVENIAQTCAARIGYINKYIFHKDVNIGFIGAVRNLKIYQLPLVLSTIETRIDILCSSFGLILAHGVASLLDGTLIAEGEMKISLTNKTV